MRRTTQASRYDGLMLGETVSHYRVLDKLGSGGMGEVYLRVRHRIGQCFSVRLTIPEESRR